MMSRFEEQSTIEAIDQLSGEYPYAAALLCYTVVERVLKMRLLQEWESPELGTIRLPGKPALGEHSGKNLKELTCSDRGAFFSGVVRKLSLGDVEGVFPDHKGNIAQDRNDLVHSNLYLRDELGTDTRKADRKRYLKAIEHLCYAIETHTAYRITIVNGDRLKLRKENDSPAT